jgi:6-phosphogluconolactonase (cycloisomerase 2 family)
VINDTACLDRKRGILYCTDQHSTRPRTAMGSEGLIHAFRIDPLSGSLTEISASPSYGALPAYVAVDATGDYLIATHHTDRVAVNKVTKSTDGKFRMTLDYDDATTVLFRLRNDGAIGDVADIHVHKGSGGPSPKQTHPQLHSVMMSPSRHFFAVTDKGNDQIFMFRINREKETLEVCGGAPFQSIPGSSPRYIAFHPSRAYLFVNHEEMPIVSALRYDHNGTLATIATASVLPDDNNGNPHVMQSDIRIHPSGKYLYSLIRRLNAVAVLAVDQDTGAIDRIQFVTIPCAEPRGCAISPDGRLPPSQANRCWSTPSGAMAPSATRHSRRASPAPATSPSSARVLKLSAINLITVLSVLMP